MNAPCDLFVRCDFENAVSVSSADQRVSAVQAQDREALISEGFQTVAAFRFLSEERYFIAPDNFSGGIVLAHRAVGFVADEVVAVVDFASQSGVAMDVRMVDFQSDFFQQFPGRIDFDDSCRSRLGNHRDSISQSLKRMNLDWTTYVSVTGGRVVFPDDFVALRVDFQQPCHRRLKQNVARRKNVEIVQRSDLVLPLDVAFLIDDRDSLF